MTNTYTYCGVYGIWAESQASDVGCGKPLCRRAHLRRCSEICFLDQVSPARRCRIDVWIAPVTRMLQIKRLRSERRSSNPRRNQRRAPVFSLRIHGRNTQITFARAAQAADDTVVQTSPGCVGLMTVFAVSDHGKTCFSDVSL